MTGNGKVENVLSSLKKSADLCFVLSHLHLKLDLELEVQPTKLQSKLVRGTSKCGSQVQKIINQAKQIRDMD